MRILFVTHYTELYGANKSLLNLIIGLERYNIKSMVVIPEKGDVSRVLELQNIPFVIQRFNWWCDFTQESPKNGFKRVISQLRRLVKIRREKIDNKKHLKELFYKIEKFSPQLIYSNSSVFNFGFLFGKFMNVPHVWHLREFGKKDYGLSFYFDRKFVSESFNESDDVISISESIKDYYIKNFNLKKSQVIYNGVLNLNQLKEIDNRRAKLNRFQSSDLTFGVVGLLHKNKGQEEAIRAMRIVCDKYSNVKLLLAGGGNNKHLIKVVNELNLENSIQFLGYIEDPFEVFLKIDAHLMCSRNEGLGRVTLEAMACNIPVIGYKGGGSLEIIDEYVTGLFYETDYKELAEKMIFLIENKESRISMGIQARQIFEKKYTTELYTEKIYNILKKYN